MGDRYRSSSRSRFRKDARMYRYESEVEMNWKLAYRIRRIAP